MTWRRRMIHVGQGEHYVSRDHDVMATAILGSCVAACIWDERVGVGGMNHILLPSAGASGARASSYAVNAMELLINGLLREGAVKSELRAKLFGGAKMIAARADIGLRNAEVTREFLQREGIPCVSESLGGSVGRRVQFWPTSGRARMQLLKDRVVEERNSTMQTAPSDLELF